MQTYLAKTSFRLCLIIFTFTLFSTINAQDNIVTPYNNTLRMEVLKPYKTTYNVIVESPKGKQNYGKLIDEMKVIEKNGNNYFERIQRMPGINLIDTSVNMYSNLAPIHHAGHNKSGYMYLHFTKSKVTGEKYFSKNDSTFMVNTKMERSYFDSNMFEVVLMALPLKKNYETKVPYYLFESGGYVLYDAKVIGEDKIDDGNGNMAYAWILETSDGSSKTDIYISKETREVLKKVSVRSPQVKILFEKVPNDQESSKM